jgi:hypothetical protein
VFRQHAAGKGFNLAEGDGLETAGAFKAQRKSAYAAEQVKQAQLIHASAPKSQTRHRAP